MGQKGKQTKMCRLLEKTQVRLKVKSRSALRSGPSVGLPGKLKNIYPGDIFSDPLIPHSTSTTLILKYWLFIRPRPKLQKQKAVVSLLFWPQTSGIITTNLSCLCLSLFLSGLSLIVPCYKLLCILFGLSLAYKFVSKALNTYFSNVVRPVSLKYLGILSHQLLG